MIQWLKIPVFGAASHGLPHAVRSNGRIVQGGWTIKHHTTRLHSLQMSNTHTPFLTENQNI